MVATGVNDNGHGVQMELVTARAATTHTLRTLKITHRDYAMD